MAWISECIGNLIMCLDRKRNIKASIGCFQTCTLYQGKVSLDMAHSKYDRIVTRSQTKSNYALKKCICQVPQKTWFCSTVFYGICTGNFGLRTGCARVRKILVFLYLRVTHGFWLGIVGLWSGSDRVISGFDQVLIGSHPKIRKIAPKSKIDAVIFEWGLGLQYWVPKNTRQSIPGLLP
jgi:hypothetical protein